MYAGTHAYEAPVSDVHVFTVAVAWSALLNYGAQVRLYLVRCKAGVAAFLRALHRIGFRLG